jgi:2-polyprenyl-6-methoxyphenol hydroxylase-like FAD-dependent oxidoreductase
VAPEFADRASALSDWDQIKLLTVTVDRLREWARPGLICIGDCAHAMSPIGGVGINLAIQDAVATGKHTRPYSTRSRANTRRAAARASAARAADALIQALQRAIQNNVMARVLNLKSDPKPPIVVRLFNRCPYLRRIPAWLVGIGFRPEHVHLGEA